MLTLKETIDFNHIFMGTDRDALRDGHFRNGYFEGRIVSGLDMTQDIG